MVSKTWSPNTMPAGVVYQLSSVAQSTGFHHVFSPVAMSKAAVSYPSVDPESLISAHTSVGAHGLTLAIAYPAASGASQASSRSDSE